MHPKRLFLFFLTLLILPAGGNLVAQWIQVNDSSFDWKDTIRHDRGKDVLDGSIGALAVSGHTVWAGQNGLWYSDDTAKTWHRSGLLLGGTSVIHDINFFDRLNGLVATSDFGVMKTTDGGKTWKQILLESGVDFWKAMFNGSPNIIHATSSEKGICYTSLDGGKTWNESYLGPFVSCMAIAPDHTVYVFAQQIYQISGRGWINYSTDYGVTWQRDSLSFADGDSYTLSVDSCNRNKLYLLNEDFATSNDGISEIFITNDLGHSWSTFDKKNIPYLTGALATTPNCLFAGTLTDGIIRSTDKGITWEKIGGPRIQPDSRTLDAMGDNILFAITDGEHKGQIWYTLNCGAHYFNPQPPKAPSLSFSSRRIINDSSNIQIHLPFYFQHSGDISDIHFIVHYPYSSLKPIDARLYDSTQIDIPTESWLGRMSVRIPGADFIDAPDSLAGYINFTWKPIEYDCAYINFDSVMTDDACAPFSFNSFTGVIGSLPSCAASVAGDKEENIAITFFPNPAIESGTLSIRNYMGEIHGRIYDYIGREKVEIRGNISPDNPLEITLRELPAGIYDLRIQTSREILNSRVIIMK